MQERQPYEIINCGNISFIPTLDAVLQCCRIFEGQFARAADGVDLDPQPIDGVDDRGFPDLGGVSYPDALAGLGHPRRAYASICSHWPILGKLETTALPRRRTPRLSIGLIFWQSCSASQSRNRRLTLPGGFFGFDPELAIVRHTSNHSNPALQRCIAAIRQAAAGGIIGICCC